MGHWYVTDALGLAVGRAVARTRPPMGEGSAAKERRLVLALRRHDRAMKAVKAATHERETLQQRLETLRKNIQNLVGRKHSSLYACRNPNPKPSGTFFINLK